jgi:hypothetical protein
MVNQVCGLVLNWVVDFLERAKTMVRWTGEHVFVIHMGQVHYMFFARVAHDNFYFTVVFTGDFDCWEIDATSFLTLAAPGTSEVNLMPSLFVLSMLLLTNDLAARDSKQYFTCPPNCGVFVATTKLSAPTVGAGAIHRPSSVASSRGGRATPSVSTSMQSGRVTPSGSNGRVTPSFGRITPGTTPSSSRMRAFSRSTVKTPTISSQRKSYG